MAIEAPYSKFKLNNCKIYAAVCIVMAIILAYDGYLSKYEWSKRQSFYNKHVDSEGKMDDMMKFNRNTPLVLMPLAAWFAVRFFMLRSRKIVADDNGITIDDKTIAYDSIESINKTNFDSKGFFTVTYKDSGGSECEQKFSDRSFDKLPSVLDHIVAKIS